MILVGQTLWLPAACLQQNYVMPGNYEHCCMLLRVGRDRKLVTKVLAAKFHRLSNVTSKEACQIKAILQLWCLLGERMKICIFLMGMSCQIWLSEKITVKAKTFFFRNTNTNKLKFWRQHHTICPAYIYESYEHWFMYAPLLGLWKKKIAAANYHRLSEEKLHTFRLHLL